MKNSPPLLLATCLTLCLTWNAQGQTDSNNNGMGDEWEKAWNNGLLLPSTFLPQADEDNDGWTNLQESTAGTNPFDGNPPNGILLPEISVIPATYEPIPRENKQPTPIHPPKTPSTPPHLHNREPSPPSCSTPPSPPSHGPPCPAKPTKHSSPKTSPHGFPPPTTSSAAASP